MRYVVSTRSGALNVRRGPGHRHPVIGSLAKGAVVDVVATRNGYGQLESGGWAATDYLAAAGSPDSQGTGREAPGGQLARMRATRRPHQESANECLIADHDFGHIISFPSYKLLDGLDFVLGESGREEYQFRPGAAQTAAAGTGATNSRHRGSRGFAPQRGQEWYETWTKRNSAATSIKYHSCPVNKFGIIGVYNSQAAAAAECGRDHPWAKGSGFECWVKKPTKAFYIKQHNGGIIGCFQLQEDARDEAEPGQRIWRKSR